MSKKILRWGIYLLSSTILLTSCGKTDNDITEPKLDPAKPVHISFTYRLAPVKDGGDVAKTVEKWNKANAALQVDAQYEKTDDDNYYRTLEQDITAGKGSCVVQMGYDRIPYFAAKGILKDVSKAASVYKDKYYPGPWSLVSPQGKTYGMPFTSETLIYLYRTTGYLYGLLDVDPPKTYEEIWSKAPKSRRRSMYITLLYKGEIGNTIAAFAAAAGNDWYSYENGHWQVNVANPQMLQWAKLMQKAVDTEANPVLSANDELGEKITAGVVGGYPAPVSDILRRPGEYLEKDGKWKAKQIGSKYSADLNGQALVITKTCKYPIATLKFINWYTTSIKDILALQKIPAAKGKIEGNDIVTKAFPNQDVMGEISKAVASQNTTWAYPASWPDIKKQIESDYTQGATIDELFKRTQYESVRSLLEMGQKAENAKGVTTIDGTTTP